MFFLLATLSFSDCELEEAGFCNFTEHFCRFSDNDAFNSLNQNFNTPLALLLNQPINNKDVNRNCRAPKKGDPPFQVHIEPCYPRKGEPINDSIFHCPDIPHEYYTDNLIEVLGSNAQPHRKIKFVSGVPTEFNILHVGKHYMYDVDNTRQPEKKHETRATPLSQYTFRALPIDTASYKTLMLQTDRLVADALIKEINPDAKGNITGASAPWAGRTERMKDLFTWYSRLICEREVGETEGTRFNNCVENLKSVDANPPSRNVPWAELTCPLEVMFGDTRTESMSIKQQHNNIFVSASTLVTEIPSVLKQHGYGCYMCTKPKRDTLFDTLKTYKVFNEHDNATKYTHLTWLQHYDDEMCEIKSILPSMTADAVDSELDLEGVSDTDACNVNAKDRLHTFRLNTKTKTRPLKDIIAGVYTLYPYIEVPTLSRSQLKDDATKKNFEDRMAEQLKYYTDPDYWVTVEVVGMSKSVGGKVVRNFHGMMLDEGIAEPVIKKTRYEEEHDPNQVTPQYPEVCLIRGVDLDKWEGCSGAKEVQCKSKLEILETALKGRQEIDMSINIQSGIPGTTDKYGQSDTLQQLYGWAQISTSQSPTLISILDEDLTGLAKVIKVNFTWTNEEREQSTLSDAEIKEQEKSVSSNEYYAAFHHAQRKSDNCIARPGKIEITVLFGRIFKDWDEVAFNSGEGGRFGAPYYFKGKTMTKVFEACDPKGVQHKGRTEDRRLKYKIQQIFRQIAVKNNDLVCYKDELAMNSDWYQPCFDAIGYENDIRVEWGNTWPMPYQQWVEKQGGEFELSDTGVSNFKWYCLKDFYHSGETIFEGSKDWIEECAGIEGCSMTGNCPGGFCGFDKATGKRALPGSGLLPWVTSDSSLKSELEELKIPHSFTEGLDNLIDCPTEWECLSFFRYPHCWPKYKFQSMRWGYMGYPPGEGEQMLGGGLSDGKGGLEGFKKEMLQDVLIDGQWDPPHKLTDGNFNILEDAVQCRFETPAKFFLHDENDHTDDGDQAYYFCPAVLDQDTLFNEMGGNVRYDPEQLVDRTGTIDSTRKEEMSQFILWAGGAASPVIYGTPASPTDCGPAVRVPDSTDLTVYPQGYYPELDGLNTADYWSGKADCPTLEGKVPYGDLLRSKPIQAAGFQYDEENPENNQRVKYFFPRFGGTGNENQHAPWDVIPCYRGPWNEEAQESVEDGIRKNDPDMPRVLWRLPNITSGCAAVMWVCYHDGSEGTPYTESGSPTYHSSTRRCWSEYDGTEKSFTGMNGVWNPYRMWVHVLGAYRGFDYVQQDAMFPPPGKPDFDDELRRDINHAIPSISDFQPGCPYIIYPGNLEEDGTRRLDNPRHAFKAEFGYPINCAELAHTLPEDSPYGQAKDGASGKWTDFKFTCTTQAPDNHFRPDILNGPPTGTKTSRSYETTCMKTLESWRPKFDDDTGKPIYGGFRAPKDYGENSGLSKNWAYYQGNTEFTTKEDAEAEGENENNKLGKYGQFATRDDCETYCNAFTVQEGASSNHWVKSKRIRCRKYEWWNVDRSTEAYPASKCSSDYITKNVEGVLMGLDKHVVPDDAQGSDGFGITDWYPTNVYGGLEGGMPTDKRVQAVVDEVNILGVSIFHPLLAKTRNLQFPNGLVITSANPNIHSRISRNLGSGEVTKKGCNVLNINILKNVSVYNMDLDNSGCQDQGMSQLLKGLEETRDASESTTEEDLFRSGLLDLKAWNMAPIHISKTTESDPTDLKFSNIKLTASISFRKLFPGRPLLSVDNANGPYPNVNVQGMSLNLINDTHNYRDDRDTIEDPVPLQPLQAIFWNVKGDIFFGEFTDPFDAVIFGKPGEHHENTDIESLGKVFGFCRGTYTDDTGTSRMINFGDDDISNPTRNGVQFKSLEEFNEACLSFEGCFLQTILAKNYEGNFVETIKNWTCMNSTLKYPDQHLILLDGSDFYDIAYDRYRCFDTPKIGCTFNYLEPVLVALGCWYYIFPFIFYAC